MTRRVPLEGVENFRDFGGYAGRDGQRLRRGLLYRSAAHGAATDADLEAMEALQIALIVDLRRRAEQARDPSRRHPAFAGQVIASETGDDEEEGWIAHVSRSDLSEAWFRDYMVDYYRKVPFDERIVEIFRRYFAALAETEGPILVHCAAGKDRTGLLVALTHHLAGVHPDDILADYMLTNDPVRMERRLPFLTEAIANLAGRTPSAEAVRVAMSVEAEYLKIALDAIVERHGGLDAYLEEVLGVDAARRAALERRLLEPDV